VNQIIGKIQLDSAERLDYIGDDRIEALVALVPRDVLVDGPTAPSLGLCEETAVKLLHG
jgi:hypothetical protein